jgi:hypothetical protein
VCVCLAHATLKAFICFFFIYEKHWFPSFSFKSPQRRLVQPAIPVHRAGTVSLSRLEIFGLRRIFSLVRQLSCFVFCSDGLPKDDQLVACSMTLGRPAFSFSGRANKVVQVSPQQSKTRAGEINSLGFFLWFWPKTKKMVSSLLFPVIRRSASDVP